jgi:deaminated glutathione amidase
MSKSLRVGLIQTNVGPNIDTNLTDIEPLIRDAAHQGARLIVTPENTCHMLAPHENKLLSAKPEESHPALPFFTNLARELNVYLLAGSVSILISPSKMANRSYLFAPTGNVQATYDKIHLFDADLPTGERYRESDRFTAGDRAVVSDIDDIRVGLTICYDLRFPHLYRTLTKAGAKILMAPSAYTVPTGKVHWHTLLRSRAIENGAFVVAPAQVGTHGEGRETFGHSLVVNPWGEIIAERLEPTAGVLVTELDISDVDRARQAIPALRHDREFRLEMQ